jgi:hypothetical protein
MKVKDTHKLIYLSITEKPFIPKLSGENAGIISISIAPDMGQYSFEEIRYAFYLKKARIPEQTAKDVTMDEVDLEVKRMNEHDMDITD